MVGHTQLKKNTHTHTKLRGFSPQANYTDCSLSAKLVPTFEDNRGCRVEGAADPQGP
jgi:hypothetical protein